jgi:gliding motility-associated-like protein
MRRILILWHIALLPIWLEAQNCGISDTIRIAPNTGFDYTFNIFDVVNGDLSDPNQGICGIEIEFLHQLSRVLEIELISPAGQVVRLIGPNTGTFVPTSLAARWNITFLPCAETPMPDSGYVARWNNMQPRNFVNGGFYFGSYHPYQGCLEDFNTGSVNGTWTIRIRNNPSLIYAGAILNFRLRLCDERGLLCCFANAGSLADYLDVSACAGSESLNLDIPPDYLSYIPPDTTDYAYTYVISQNNLIIAYDSLSDLRNYPAGVYRVCGLSYKKTERALFPPANGTVRLDTLRRNLNTFSPLFCGRINNNCVDVNITSAPDTTVVNQAICEGEFFEMAGTRYDTNGTYFIRFAQAADCDSLVQLNLTVRPIPVNNIERTICNGDSVIVGTAAYRTAGFYPNILMGANGCDSLVNLTLRVQDAVVTNITADICAGDVYVIGNQSFSESGSHQVILSAASGCDSVVNLNLTVLAPVARIASVDTLDCNTTQVTLDGSASTPLGAINFQWLDSNGTEIGVTPTLMRSDPGVYILSITQTGNNATCIARDTITVVQNTLDKPQASIALPPEITCANALIILDGSASTQGPGVQYAWTGPSIRSGADTPSPTVDAQGTYQLIVKQGGALCSDTATVTVLANLEVPIADSGSNFELTCANPTVTIGGPNTSDGPAIRYSWQTQDGRLLGPTDVRTPTTDAAGTYTLIVTNVLNACADTSNVIITTNQTPPTVAIAAADTITCASPGILLDGSTSAQGANIRYTWTNTAGTILGAATILNVSQPGRYFLEVFDTDNGCTATDSVLVSATTDVPVISFGPSQILCDSALFTLEAFVQPAGGAYSYAWSGPGIVGANDQQSIRINTDGEYILTVVNLQNNCTTTDTLIVTQQICDICINGFIPDTLNCTLATVTLRAAFCSDCSDCTIEWVTPNGNIVSGNNTLTPVVDAPGSYMLTVTNSSGFSVMLVYDVIQNVQLPTADAGDDQQLTCTNPDATIGGPNTSRGSQFQYQWRSQNGASITPDNALIVALVNQADTFFLEVINTESGCRAVDTVVVTANVARPMANAGASQTLTCITTSLLLDGSASSAGSDIVYNWITTNGNIVSGGNTSNPIVDRPGTYTLIVTNALNGCADTANVQINAGDDRPEVPVFADTTLTCLVTSIVLNGATPPVGNFQTQWCELDANNNAINCITGLSINASSPSRYRFEITDLNTGCSNSTTLTVRADQEPPQVDAGPPDTLGCTQNELIINGIALPAGANYRYEWRAENGSPIQNADTPTPTITQADTYQFMVTNLDNGCAAMDSVTILLNAETPIVFAGFDTLLTCALTSIQLNASAIGNNLQYEWNSTEGNIVSGATTLTPVIDRQGAYILTATNAANGCFTRDTIIIGRNIFPPNAAVANSNELALTCETNLVTLDGSFSTSQTGGTLRYTWEALQGRFIGAPNASTVQVDAVGRFRLIVEDTRNSCRDSVTVDVTRDVQLPQIVAATPAPLTCIRDSTTISATVTNVGMLFQTRWTNPLGLPLPNTELSILATQAGAYTLTIRNPNNGCEDSLRINVPLDTIAPPVTIAPPIALDCQNSSTQLSASVAGNGNFSYAWTTANGQIISGQDANTATVNSIGLYNLLVTNNLNGCTGRARVEVGAIEAAIEQAFFTINIPDCLRPASGSIIFTAVQGGTAPYFYSVNNRPFSPEPQVQNLRAGNYTLRVQDTNGCEWETAVTIPEPAAIRVNLGRDTTIRLGDSLRIVPQITPANFSKLEWGASNGVIVNPDAIEQIVSPLETTVYTIQVVGENGCTATDVLTVFVSPKASVFIPNAFSPDGDGRNDVFMIYAGNNVQVIRNFMIFDRWGNRVYHAGPFLPNDPNFGWNGNFNGQLMNPAVFVYWVEIELIDGRVETIKGDVTLLK